MPFRPVAGRSAPLDAMLTHFNEVIGSVLFQNLTLWRIYDLPLNGRGKQLNALCATRAF